MPTETTETTEEQSALTTQEDESLETQENAEAGDIPEDETESGTDETVTFSPRQYEESLGFPAGSLKDCGTEEEALAKIRQMTDDYLNAGIGRVEPTEEPGTPTEKNADAQKQAPNPTTLESLTKKVDELSAVIAAQQKQTAEYQQANEQRALQEINQRLTKEVDSWASPKYGVSGTRSYEQNRALREFRNRVGDFVAGQSASDRACPTIEAVARSCWAHEDAKAFADHVNGKKPGKKSPPPLGTPGNATSPRGKDSPTNIHNAVFKDGRLVNASSL